jgi:hypothetical protein
VTEADKIDSVYNLQRRMASLPTISADEYAQTVATSLVPKREPLGAASSSGSIIAPKEELEEESDEIEDTDDDEVSGEINCCLFCTIASENLEANIKVSLIRWLRSFIWW